MSVGSRVISSFMSYTTVLFIYFLTSLARISVLLLLSVLLILSKNSFWLYFLYYFLICTSLIIVLYYFFPLLILGLLCSYFSLFLRLNLRSYIFLFSNIGNEWIELKYLVLILFHFLFYYLISYWLILPSLEKKTVSKIIVSGRKILNKYV